ncbi:M81 family metallopeptidase [Caballeronia sp. DA-9]|uniref:M81 family metallopeptidase n=1 Tax=Caballeronia sp. DA-9 TaxID=3436237 RepID=UPI003F672AAE
MFTIAVGGLQHETNTFSPTPTPLDAFIKGGGWPGWQKGASMQSTLAGMNLPVAGMLEALHADVRVGPHKVRPLLWAAATPSGKVTDYAFDVIAQDMIERLLAAGPVDGLILDLHGAMVTESHNDAEGELLRRIREHVGDALPIVVSLDLHANVSRSLFDACDAMVTYRTYPHIDMRETGARAVALLLQRMERGRTWHKAFTAINFIAPLTAQCTLAEPASSLMAGLEAIEASAGLASLSWACGFPLADIADARQTVFGYGDDPRETEIAVASLAADISACRDRFTEAPYTPDAAVKEAMRLAVTASLPVILCDTNDNPGAGGSSDTTGILRALVDHHAQNALVAIVCDPSAAAAAHTAKPGATLALALGGHVRVAGSEPFIGRFVVERLASGQFTGTGPMWRNAPIDLGPMALLCVEHTTVRVIVSSRTMQAADQSIFRHVGIDPASTAILALKSSVHFRADFSTISSSVLVVAAPGACVVGVPPVPS